MEFSLIEIGNCNFTIKEFHQRMEFSVNFEIGLWNFTGILKAITALFLLHFDICSAEAIIIWLNKQMNTNLTNSIYLIDEKGKKRLLQRLLVLMLFLLYWQFGSLPVLSDIAIIVSAWFVVFKCLYPFYSNAFLYVLYLINFTFNDFIFSITHSGFSQKIITHILEILYL